MKILTYEAVGGPQSDLHFSIINFSKLNLIVGASASGKTRLLNTIFNGALQAVHGNKIFIGSWDYKFEHQKQIYRWTITTGPSENEETIVQNEKLIKINEEEEIDEVLIERSPTKFMYFGRDLPKLTANQSSIFLLKEDDLIKPIHLGFSSILRRSFAGDELEREGMYEIVPKGFIKKIEKSKNIFDLFGSGLQLNGKLYILSKYFENVYQRICREFINIFPFVSEVHMETAERFGLSIPGIAPVFSIQEKYIKNKLIPLNQLSSGMKKVLLVLADLFTMPKEGGIYLIDEYENSLGINAINFFPSIFNEVDIEHQYIITSHHPYIIGNVPIKDWIILHRKGIEITAKQGSELENRFEKSKQKAYVQLINDPFYTDGVE